MSSSLSLAAAAALAVLVVLLLWWALRPRGPRYRARALMSPAEKQFFAILRRAVPELHVFPQVSMGAIMEAAVDMQSASRRDARRALGDWARIRANRIDFCLADEALDVVCLVELDDRSHHGDEARARDADRDARAAEAGYLTVRFGWSNGRLPSSKAVRERLLQALGQAD
ncbi:DUF2726 domain-containing protein [Caldimonas tepidiphila]|uniref:DUF2726 domain-containing protein n=1 Tax=Caldimonas tepidiphila TaxID=2315841 RepID=UPI000E5B477C|nr:DUF2726 domain-containing protein [Caldimonas tepidiphila]